MRVVLAQLDPVRGDPTANVATVRQTVTARTADLFVFPELFLTGYRVGDALHRLAAPPGADRHVELAGIARDRGTTIIVGDAVRHARPGEIENAAVIATPDGQLEVRAKRFLPTYGPFEEGSVFTPEGHSRPASAGGRRLGIQICYDVFFPEVSRELAMGSSELLVVLSAAPVTSRALFDRVLPARAVENALPLVYVNRVGVEDGLVFGGGSIALDARGAPVPLAADPPLRERSDPSVLEADLDLSESARWRPFRPVLRDVADRRPAPSASRDLPRDRWP